jgi:transcriptional regulator with XRE-family HTH domain
MKSIEKDELLLKLANRIKGLRIERNFTQEDTFNDTGIHFGRIEQGKRDISFTSLKKICDYFNITLEEFFSKGFDK